MTDKQLFELIERIVRQRRAAVSKPQSQNFAQNYCKQQMAKKKLVVNNNKQKMNYLMKNFSKLQTYFDLPQLLNQLNSLKVQQQTLNEFLPRSISTKKLIVDEPRPITRNTFSGEFKNLRFVLQDNFLKNLIHEIENENEWKSQVLKNNTALNLQNLMTENGNVKDQKQQNKLFEMLRNYREHPFAFIQNENKNIKYKESLLNNEKNKIIKNFIHKVSSYLQIILENQHKSKWNKTKNKIRSSILKKNFSIHKFTSLHSNPSNFSKENKKQFIVRKSFTKTITLPQQQAQVSIVNRPKYIINKTKNKTSNILVQKLINKEVHSMSTNPNQSSQIMKSPSGQSVVQKRSQNLKDIFTFRKRNIKQNIITKLDKFLGEIDEEQQCNKLQNQYYNVQINRLQTKYKNLYGKHRRETLATEQDVKKIQMLISGQKGSVMMSRKASKLHISNSGKSNHASTNNLNIPTFDNNNNTEKSSIE